MINESLIIEYHMIEILELFEFIHDDNDVVTFTSLFYYRISILLRILYIYIYIYLCDQLYINNTLRYIFLWIQLIDS